VPIHPTHLSYPVILPNLPLLLMETKKQSKRDRKRQATSSPTAYNPNESFGMDEYFAALNAKLDTKLDAITARLDKLDSMETAVGEILKENVTMRENLAAAAAENVKKDAIISLLNEQVNRCDQELRSKSLRIIGLPITSTTPHANIPDIVFSHIISPIIEAAKANGELPTNSIPGHHFIIDSAFAIPTKKGNNCQVIVKLSSMYIRNMIFRLKKTTFAKTMDPVTRKERSAYAIHEDLAPANYQLLRSFADDPKVKSAWSYNGQIKFRLHDDDTIYRAKHLTDTVDSVCRRSSTTSATPP